ncbi:MAG: CpaF family protein [Pirellulaceae bacterium]|nr:CpaF family protein [Pirellulaceae bacterium]
MLMPSYRPATALADPLVQAETLEAEFQRIKTGIHRELIDALDLSRITGLSDDELREDIRRLAEGMLRGRSKKLPAIDEERLVDELLAESFGLGPLEPYMQDPDVTDILVNGAQEVYVERLGRLQETNTVFADDDHLLQIIQRVAARVGRRIDEHSPMVDARLADGSRVNAIIPPLALGGPVLSIRRFGHRPLQVADLLVRGSVCPEMLQLIESAVEGRINIMISGGTGAGKTTFLNNVSRFIPATERLVTIEDSAELKLQRKHVVKLETRPQSAEGTSEISQRDLVKNALRMRPDRIILGEVRGGEALDMLQAMNTGHEGSLTTIHANDTRDALSRLEVMVSMAGFDLPVTVVRRYIASAITMVIHLARLKGGARRVMKISEIMALDSGDYVIQDLFGFQQTGVDDRGLARGHFFATGNRPQFARRLAEQGIDLPARLFEQRNLTTDSAIGPISYTHVAEHPYAAEKIG